MATVEVQASNEVPKSFKGLTLVMVWGSGFAENSQVGILLNGGKAANTYIVHTDQTGSFHWGTAVHGQMGCGATLTVMAHGSGISASGSGEVFCP
jgi:hypothetical protein